MILQRFRIIVGDAGFEPGTSTPEVWCTTNENKNFASSLYYKYSADSEMSFYETIRKKHHLGPQLKVQCHEIFYLRFFHPSNILIYLCQLLLSLPPFLKHLLRAVLVCAESDSAQF